MAVKIRLSRGGKKKAPFYKIVAADSRFPRDGRYLEKLGTYNPASKEIVLNKESVGKWLSEGAAPSDTMAKLLIKEGVEIPERYKTTYAPK